ncbi:hypothetical protein DFH28DRAFT_1167151 [Melampsora americana]|nr:hypothetical protein DFH28DRAFT_1167151 [Melampsora americana]
MSRSERRLKSLDHHFRSHQSKERSHEIQIKLNLLNKRQEWLDKSIKALSKHQNSKTKSFNHLPAPPTIMTMTKLNYKELKKIKSTVERCKIYASTLNQVNSEPIGLDLWIWYKTHGMDQQQVNQNETHSSKNSNGYPHNLQQTLIRSSHEATRHSSLEDKGTRPSIGKSNYVPHNQSNSIPIPPLSPIPVHLQQFQSTNLPPHSRDVSSGSSSVASFPVRSDAVKAIEITEKKGGPQLMEIVNCTTGNNGLNPLIQVDNLPFPGLYQHGKSQANAIAPDFSTFSFKPTSSQSPAPPPPLTPTRNVTNISHPIPMSKPYSIPTSQPSTQVNRSFLSQLTRRNSHKKVNLQSHHHHHHHHLNSNPSSSNPALPEPIPSDDEFFESDE